MEPDRSFVCQGVQNGMIERRDAVIIEFGGNGSKHRHTFRRLVPGRPVSLNLLSDIPDGIFPAALFIFIHDHDIGEIEHIDFFKLGGGAELAGHDIHGHVHDIGNERVALTDARGFSNDQIKTGGLQGLDGFTQGVGDFRVGLAGGQGPLYGVVAV